MIVLNILGYFIQNNQNSYAELFKYCKQLKKNDQSR